MMARPAKRPTTKIGALVAALAVCAALVGGATPVCAQEPGRPIPHASLLLATSPEQPIPSSATLHLMRAIEDAWRDVRTVHATFDQTRLDEVFEEEIVSPGEMWFDRPDRFRCDYAEPRALITLILPEILFIYVPEIEQVDYWRFENADERDRQMHHLLIGFGFDTEELIEQYIVTRPEDDAPRLRVEPRPWIAETCPFTEMELIVNEDTLRPERIRYMDPSGNEFTLTMKTVETDMPLDDALFDKEAVFPKNVDYVDKREML